MSFRLLIFPSNCYYIFKVSILATPDFLFLTSNPLNYNMFEFPVDEVISARPSRCCSILSACLRKQTHLVCDQNVFVLLMPLHVEPYDDCHVFLALFSRLANDQDHC